MLSSVKTIVPASVLNGVTANDFYISALDRAAERMRKANVDETVSRREKLCQELNSWAQQMPPPFPQSMMSMGPEDVLAFLEGYWLARHAGSKLPDSNGLVASPSGLESAISHLSTAFGELGRHGAYNAATGTGNPCASMLVQRYKKGYRRGMWEAGYQEKSAVPIDEVKMHKLVDHIDALGLAAPSLFGKITSERDALLVVYEWSSSMRGKEGGQLCLLDFHDSDHRPYFQSGYVPLGRPPASVIVLPTHGTKTNKRGRTEQEPIYIEMASDLRYCFISRLWRYLDLCHLSGYEVRHYLFRPETPDGQGFKEQGYSSSSFTDLIKKRLKGCGIYDGETGHSFRRGSIQDRFCKEGLLGAAVQGRIKTPSILQRYLDPKRHLSRLRSD